MNNSSNNNNNKNNKNKVAIFAVVLLLCGCMAICVNGGAGGFIKEQQATTIPPSQQPETTTATATTSPSSITLPTPTPTSPTATTPPTTATAAILPHTPSSTVEDLSDEAKITQSAAITTTSHVHEQDKNTATTTTTTTQPSSTIEITATTTATTATTTTTATTATATPLPTPTASTSASVNVNKQTTTEGAFQVELKDNERCFRDLHGVVEDCRCSVDSVDRMNSNIYNDINTLLQLDYFKFYKSNFNSQCPFWSDEGECRSKQCAVTVCTDDDIPLGLKIDKKAGRVLDCQDGGTDLADVLHTISDEERASIERWNLVDEHMRGFCHVDDDSNNGVFVNLLDNPERFTGYIGNSPGKIWRAIYSENCFKPDNFDPRSFLTQRMVRDMCMEKRVFYRVVSGLHACINLHVAASYPSSPGGFPPRPTVWGPNSTMFDIFFDPSRTFGEGPSRLHNMYFTYLLLLRALVKGAPMWDHAHIHSGNTLQDEQAEAIIRQIVHTSSDCGATFDESLMFQDSVELKAEFSMHFRNVSRIMDCVGCEKCRLWGKLQVQGLSAAMKILFSSNIDVKLTHNEVVSLFVTFGRFSQAIHELEIFRQLKRMENNFSSSSQSKSPRFEL